MYKRRYRFCTTIMLISKRLEVYIGCSLSQNEVLENIYNALNINIHEINKLQMSSTSKTDNINRQFRMRNRKADVMLYESMRSFKLNRHSLIRLIKKTKYNRLCELCDMVANNKNSSGKHCFKEIRSLLSEDRFVYQFLITQHMLTKEIRLKWKYGDYFKVNKKYISRFMHHREHEYLHSKPFVRFSRKLEFLNSGGVHKTMGLIARFFNDTNHFMHIMLDSQKYKNANGRFSVKYGFKTPKPYC